MTGHYRRRTDPLPLPDRDRRALARLAAEFPRLRVAPSTHRDRDTGSLEGIGWRGLHTDLIGFKTVRHVREFCELRGPIDGPLPDDQPAAPAEPDPQMTLWDGVAALCAVRPPDPAPDVPDHDHDQHSEPEEPC